MIKKVIDGNETPLAIDSIEQARDVNISAINDGDVLAFNEDANAWQPSGALKYLYNNTGGKNLNSYPYYETTKVSSGLTFIDAGDGTIGVSAGTVPASGSNADFIIHHRLPTNANPCKLNNGTYILTGCPSGGSSATYFMEAYYIDSNNVATFIGEETGNGLTFTVNGGYYSPDYIFIQLRIYVKKGTTLSAPLTFKPMIRDASISDDTYVPYAMTNRELTEKFAPKTMDYSYDTLSVNTDYIVPEDGYLRVVLSNVVGAYIRIAAYMSDGNTVSIFELNNATANYYSQAIYLRKGMKIVPTSISSGSVVRFYKLK